MNRLSFLKTLGIGVAAAVITPKILGESNPDAIPKWVDSNDEVGKTQEYGHYHEDMVYKTKENLRLNDLCIDKNERVWLCTGMMFDTIELTALEPEPQPNFIEIKRSSFDEYFIIFSSAFGGRS